MYERAFDTEWESLSGDEAIRRMYVLGIATELGHAERGERDRIRDLAGSAYERSVLDLAFQEGRREVQDVRPLHESDEETWSVLVDADDATVPDPDALQPDSGGRETPDAVDRPSLLGGYDIDELGRLSLPSFLTREE